MPRLTEGTGGTRAMRTVPRSLAGIALAAVAVSVLVRVRSGGWTSPCAHAAPVPGPGGPSPCARKPRRQMRGSGVPVRTDARMRAAARSATAWPGGRVTRSLSANMSSTAPR